MNISIVMKKKDGKGHLVNTISNTVGETNENRFDQQLVITGIRQLKQNKEMYKRTLQEKLLGISKACNIHIKFSA